MSHLLFCSVLFVEYRTWIVDRNEPGPTTLDRDSGDRLLDEELRLVYYGAALPFAGLCLQRRHLGWGYVMLEGEVQIDRDAVCSPHGIDLEERPDVARLERRRKETVFLLLVPKLGWVDELPDRLRFCPLAAPGNDAHLRLDLGRARFEQIHQCLEEIVVVGGRAFEQSRGDLLLRHTEDEALDIDLV